MDYERRTVNVAGGLDAAFAAGRLPREAPLSDQRLHAILEFIESNMHRPVSVNEMAAALRMSPFHFARCFTRTFGQSPHAFLTLRRIERAKRLIAGGALPLKSVAAQVGFRTQSHFTGVFAKFAGMSPGRYRETMAIKSEEYRRADENDA